MSLPRTLLTTLVTDLASGAWHPSTYRFWEAKLQADPALASRTSVLRVLAHDCATGRWSPLTRQVFAHLLGTSPPSVMATLQQDFRAGQWGPLTRQTMEQL